MGIVDFIRILAFLLILRIFLMLVVTDSVLKELVFESKFVGVQII